VLTADLVNARRRGTELLVAKLSEASRATAHELATALLALYRHGIGESRQAVDVAVSEVAVEARAERLKAGLVKLLEDRCDWGAETTLEPSVMREQTFLASAAARAALEPGERFDRERVLSEVAARLELAKDALEQSLFADLRGANLLLRFEDIDEAALVASYEKAQVQAVLLRAVQVRIGVRQSSATAARALFRRLKFLGLLHNVVATDGGYEIVVDGPLSLFESVTKYGMRMAQLVPLLEGWPSWTLQADVRWGKERLPLTFRAEGGGASEAAPSDPEQPEQIAALRRAFADAPGGWWASACNVVIDLPGTGLCVPDLLFRRGKTKIYFEALGYWSREAVFRRVDLVERGMTEKVLFAVSSRLRVSEEVLDDRVSSALYVFKGAMSARAITERLEQLAAR
jgi:predicted nuclease of restriction endonuclease-like RecB superfamily